MHDLAIPALDSAAVEKVRGLEAAIGAQPQVGIETHHTLHAGLYARTIKIPAGVVIAGALIKIATVLIVSGETIMYGAGGAQRLEGYNVLRGCLGRKQAFVAVTDTYLTMVFPSQAKTVADAEAEFTDEADALMSRRADAVNTMEER